MSRTDVIHPIMACIEGASVFLGPDRKWRAVNEEQNAFLSQLRGGLNDLTKLPEMKTKASYSAQEINAFLRENGFTITLEKFADDEFGVASLMRILAKWAQPGRETTLAVDGRQYEAARFSDLAPITFYECKVRGEHRVIARLETESGDALCLAMAAGLGDERYDLRKEVAACQKATRTHDYEGLVFPMVSLEETKKLEWLIGLNTIGQDGKGKEISQALQQSRLMMNHLGAKMESAVAVGVRTTSVRIPKQPLVIDEPFLFWAERTELKLPYFTAYVTPEDWKNPGDIGLGGDATVDPKKLTTRTTRQKAKKAKKPAKKK